MFLTVTLVSHFVWWQLPLCYSFSFSRLTLERVSDLIAQKHCKWNWCLLSICTYRHVTMSLELKLRSLNPCWKKVTFL